MEQIVAFIFSQAFVFYSLSTVLVFGALAVITSRNPVYSALFLVMCFVTSAGIWLLLEAEFLAITLVLVYVGAVMVLFLFVVMMLDVNLAPLKEGFARYLPLGVVVALVMLAELVLVVGTQHFGLDAYPMPESAELGFSNTQVLGHLLYTKYVYPFEIASVILLVAIVAAIALTLRKRPETRYQDPASQIRVRKEDRLRIVRMDAESGEG